MKKFSASFFLICSFFCFSLSANGYQYLLFYRNGFLPKEKEVVFDKVMKQLGEKAKNQKINIVAPEAKEFIEKYDLRCAPMPFVLVIAENGAITGSFACEWSEDELMNAIVSPAMEEILKALQSNKMVFLLLHNKKKEAMDFKGVQDFVADSKYSNISTIVHVNTSDSKEKKLLEQFQIDLSVQKDTVIFLVPPGDSLGKFDSTVSKDELTKVLDSLSSGCCCPGGCCPGGSCSGSNCCPQK